MGLFRKSPPKAPGKPTQHKPTATEAGLSIIGVGMHVEGDLTTEGTLRVEGSVRGTIRAGKSLILGKAGDVVGDIITEEAVIGGRVAGNIIAQGRLELQRTCTIEGEVRTSAEHLQLEEGARFNGQIQMLEPEQSLAKPYGPPENPARTA
jgi:cytoskeletal protein CcmA (bactofilin family)